MSAITPIHLRKKRLPNIKGMPMSLRDISDSEIKKAYVFDEHGGRIPMKDIFVDPVNGLVLFRNPATNGWITKAELREEVN